jgi:hypothetical protein
MNQRDLIQMSKNFNEKKKVSPQKKNCKVSGVRKKMSSKRIPKQGTSSRDIQISPNSYQNDDSCIKFNKDQDSKNRRDSYGSLITSKNESPILVPGRIEIPMKSMEEYNQEAYVKWIEDKFAPKRTVTKRTTVVPQNCLTKQANNNKLPSFSNIQESKKWQTSGTLGSPTKKKCI